MQNHGQVIEQAWFTDKIEATVRLLAVLCVCNNIFKSGGNGFL